ncbi:hypothetical protein [Streptococcus ovuberis]|uniref:Uncharacterized protein n=1 Tax=Streptococcus ovuberis TaxID=1936207 RepID=A0A7X6N0V5_9STRE|nr:hypothetical protein [Streptococcus ovuberis]NKZ20152.1 hypothetical protein [Streptococcus ovuberis]
MHNILTDYKTILATYPNPKQLTKLDRKKRHQLFQEWLQKSYENLPTLDEIIRFGDIYKPLLQATFFEKLSPVFLADINTGHLTAIKWLLGDGTVCAYNEPWASAFQGLNRYTIAKQVLAKEPDYRPALLYLYHLMKRQITFDLHEVPWGVLVEKGTLKENLAYVDCFEQLSQKLGFFEQDEAIADEARYHYRAWESYLSELDSYEHFAHYLAQDKK